MGLLGKRRDRKATKRKVITASGVRIDLTNRDQVRRLAVTHQTWQTDAWRYRDLIGEIRFAMQFRARAVARVRYFAAEILPDEDDPVSLDSDETTLPADLIAAAQDELSRLPWDTGYQFAGIASENFDVTGECWLHGYDDAEDGEEHWEVLSVSEVLIGQDGSISIRRYGEGMVTPIPTGPDSGHEMIRLWVPHPQFKELADSAMKSLLDVCEEIVLAGREIRAAARSRIAQNGILALSQGFSMDKESVDDDDDDDEVDSFQRDFVAGIVAPIADEGAPGSVVPMVVRGEIEDVKDGIRHISLERKTADDLLDRVERWLRRVARSLDIPPEVMSGLGDSNHWSAWQIDASTFRYHIDPSCRLLADSIALGWLRPALRAYGRWPNSLINKVTIWRDAGNLTENPNRGQDALNAFDRGGIGWKALRDALGFNDTHAPDDDELVKMIALKAGIDTGTAALLLRNALGTTVIPEPVQVPSQRMDRPAPGQVPPSADTAVPGDTAPGGNPPVPNGPSPGGLRLLTSLLGAASTTDSQETRSGTTEVDTPTGEHPNNGNNNGPTPDPEDGWTVTAATDLAEIDRQLRDRLLVAADAALNRATEVAGARLRSRAQRHPELRGILKDVSVTDIGPTLIQAYIGTQHPATNGTGAMRTTVAWTRLLDQLAVTEDDLLAGSLDRLGEQFHTWTDQAIDQAINATLALLHLTPGDPEADTLRERLRASMRARITDAWNWLREGLHRLAQRILSSPHPEPAPGELPSLSVPPGLVRGALAQIGAPRTGSGGVDDHGNPVDPASPGVPIGGIATGQDITDVLTEAGAAELGYEWAYGITPRGRQFEPHQRLDGARFATFHDEVLSTAADGNEWIGPFYFTGDHGGCMCDYVPVWAIPERSEILAANLDGQYVRDEDALAAMDDAAGRTGTTAQAGRDERVRIQALQERYITQGRAS